MGTAGGNAAGTKARGKRVKKNWSFNGPLSKVGRLDRSVKQCCLCDGWAFRVVGRRGFCEAHTAEAFAAAAAATSA